MRKLSERVTIGQYRLASDLSQPCLVGGEENWAKLCDEIAGIVGRNEEYLDALRAKTREIEYKELARGGDEFYYTLAEIEANIAAACFESSAKNKGLGFDAEIAALSQLQGYKIDKNATTVSEYYSLIKLHNNGASARTK